MLSNDFYGKKGFIWWVGVVEDDYDPLQLGSVRVRIIGVHSDDVNLVPTDSLPWAQVLRPPNAFDSLVAPKVGEWAFGFFQDGEYAQIPVVVGLFSGIESDQSRTIYETYTINKGGTNAVPMPNTTKIGGVEVTDGLKAGEPMTPKTARGIIEGSMLQVTNALRSNVCDVRPEVAKAVSYIKGQFNSVLEEVRAAIRAILAAIGLYPDGASSYLTQIIKQAAEILRKIARAIDELTREIIKLQYFLNLIQQFISWVASLPEKIAKFLKNCVDKFLKAIASGFADLFVAPTLGISSGAFKDLSDAFGEVSRSASNLIGQTARLLAMPARMARSLSSPSSTTNSSQIGLTDMERFVKGHVNAVTTTGTTSHNRHGAMSSNTIGTIV